MSFERARAIADAVLLEGYVLYPYRASSTKNRYRWTFGVLAPRDWSEAGGCEPSWLEACSSPGPRPRLRGRLRFLHVIERRVEAPDGTPLERLEVGGRMVHPVGGGGAARGRLRRRACAGRHGRAEALHSAGVRAHRERSATHRA